MCNHIATIMGVSWAWSSEPNGYIPDMFYELYMCDYHFANGMAHIIVSLMKAAASLIYFHMVCNVLFWSQVMFLPKCACTLLNCHSAKMRLLVCRYS